MSSLLDEKSLKVDNSFSNTQQVEESLSFEFAFILIYLFIGVKILQIENLPYIIKTAILIQTTLIEFLATLI